VDTVSDERGQAILAVVLALGIAAIAIVGLRSAQERIVAGASSQRAGEAAIEAAAQSVADVYAVHPTAATELVRENGGHGVERVELACIGDRIEARLVLNGYSHHAGFRAPECSLR
jgi:hypothetical protein